MRQIWECCMRRRNPDDVPEINPNTQMPYRTCPACRLKNKEQRRLAALPKTEEQKAAEQAERETQKPTATPELKAFLLQLKFQWEISPNNAAFTRWVRDQCEAAGVLDTNIPHR